MTGDRPDALPPGSVLLHIGPHKTGTTTLQSAFHSNRSALREQGVIYPGKESQPMLAALYATDRPGRVVAKPQPWHWNALVREVTSAPRDARVVVSSERFCVASAEQARRIVDALGGPRVRVVVTLRPLTSILPSQWQQYVRNGLRKGYRPWLRHVFDDPPGTKPTPDFWQRHAHDELVRRWATVAGADNVHVVVLDDRDATMLTRTFAALVGVPPELLVAPVDAANRSLTAAEIELLRVLNREFHRAGWSPELYVQFIRRAVSVPMQARRPRPNEARITTPAWAVKRATEMGARVAAVLDELGVHVIGDPARLSTPAAAPQPTKGAARLPIEAAAAAVMGAVGGGQQAGPEHLLENVRYPALLRLLAQRAGRRLRR